MSELLELRKCIEEGRYSDAIFIIDELDEMAKEDKLNKIESYAVILLLHLIKQQAEGHTTRSWERSIRNSVQAIQRTNGRRSAGGVYMPLDALQTMLDEIFDNALADAADEAFGGAFTSEHLLTLIDKQAVQRRALHLIANGYAPDESLPYK